MEDVAVERNFVIIRQPAELAYWCNFFSCSEKELKAVLRFTDETPGQVRAMIEAERKRR
jgi:hypothetical protein